MRPLLAVLLLASGVPAAAAMDEAPPQRSAGNEADAAPPQPVGERRTARTADETVLRDTAVLLPRWGQTLELGLAYSRAERDLGLVAQSAADATLTWRFGIWRELQVSARLPFRLRHTSQTSLVTAPADPPRFAETTDTHATLRDLSLGAVGVALRERPGRPNVVWTIDAVIPTGPGDAGLGAGVAATKSYDPVILFAGLSYVRGLRVDRESLDRSLARNNVGFNAGFAFAVNESVALTVQSIGSIRSAAAVASGVRPPRERYLLQLGVTWLLRPGLFVEPLVAIAVGAAAPDATFALSVPWSF